MQGHRNRGSHYYACQPHRRSPGILPEDHPRTVYLSETKAVGKVLDFLNTHVFGPDRISRLEELLDSNDSEADHAAEDIARLRSELVEIEAKIRRQLGHLEAEDAGSQAATLLRDRLRELAALKVKKGRQLEGEARALAERPTPEGAARVLELFPIVNIDVDRLGPAAIRDLLRTLNFQGAYDPRDKSLMVSVTLLPELVADDGPFTRVLSVPPTGNAQQG